MALCRTVFHLSFKYLQLAADTSGIDLLADSELVAYNLVNDEQKQAERIVKAISEKLGKGAANDPREMSLADRLAALGSKEVETEKELVGMSEAGTIILPASPPEQAPLKVIRIPFVQPSPSFISFTKRDLDRCGIFLDLRAVD